MIDFAKRLKKAEGEEIINPIDLYERLDRTSVAGPLRPVQIEILEKWFSNKRNNRDLVVKLHTGAGKTLIGLLMLLSKMHEDHKPVIYLCPNKYLVDQVYYDALKFGIPVCVITEGGRLPDEFLNNNRILITSVQKFFNGRSIFGIGNSSEKIGSIVLDDAHACLDSIRSAYTITIDKSVNSKLYDEILDLFEDSLKKQGEASYIEIRDEVSSKSIMPIPYWDWIRKKSEITKILSKKSEEKYITFVWPLIKDSLDKCNAYISSKSIQIVPLSVDIEKFQSFEDSDTRILLSATTQDDIFFVKNLGFSVEAVKEPLQPQKESFTGEKMILLPSLMSKENLDRKTIISKVCEWGLKSPFGVVVLTPNSMVQKDYEKFGGCLCDTNNIFEVMKKLKNQEYGSTVVLKNRYDGIDLPDASCRILVLDSMPFSSILEDKYEEISRKDCILVKKKLAQKIEQGLGRSVRGEKDFSCIIIVGPELVQFIKSGTTKSVFSPQTKKQVEIGTQMVEFSREDCKGEITLKEFSQLMNQCLKRDENWKEFYNMSMEKLDCAEEPSETYDMIEMERKVDELYLKNRYNDAVHEIQAYLDSHNNLSKSDKGWYLQKMARIICHESYVDSDRYQKGAFELNRNLLVPETGVCYSKVKKVDVNRVNNINEYIKKFETSEELLMEVDTILANASFGVVADKFEEAIENIGKLMGYETQRPDKYYRTGPDVLWVLGDRKYMFFECKDEVKENREFIIKDEAGQMGQHCGWFRKEYNDANVDGFFIIPTNVLASDATLSEDIRVIGKQSLARIKESILNFYQEFSKIDIQTNIEGKLKVCLEKHKFNADDICKKNSENWIKQQKIRKSK